MKKNPQLEFEVSFYEALVADKPDFIDALIPLADAYTRLGDYRKGFEIDKRLVSLCPDSASAHYNLACSYSLIGELENSLTTLQKAIDYGYSDISHMLRDPDLQAIRRDARFTVLTQKIKQLNKI